MLNEATLEQFFQDVGTKAGKELIELFIEECRDRLGRIIELAESGDKSDTATLKREIHSLKSSSKTYGVEELGILAEQLEIAANMENEAVFQSKAQGLQSLADQNLTALEAYIKAH